MVEHEALRPLLHFLPLLARSFAFGDHSFRGRQRRFERLKWRCRCVHEHRSTPGLGSKVDWFISLLHPAMIENWLNWGSIERVLLQDQGNERFAVIGHPFVVLELLIGEYSIALLLIITPSERGFTLHHFIEQHTQAPYIKFVIGGLWLDHFWSHVFYCPAEGLFEVAHFSGPSKITNLYISFMVK